MKVHSIQCANFGGFSSVMCLLDSQSAFFTGANGAGKTTLLDALNTAFTLGGGQSKYNAAGSDAKSSRGSTTRNLASYILGSADDGRLREHGAIGHVFVTLAMEAADKSGGFLHVGCIAQARLSPGGEPELVGEARGVCWASDNAEIPANLIWGDGEHGGQSPRSARDFGVQCKADGIAALVTSTPSKSEHMAFVAKHALGRQPSPEQAKALCLAMASTVKIDPEWTPNGFAKKLLSTHGAAFNAQSVANLGEAANAFEAAASALRIGQAFHDSIQRVDDRALKSALAAQTRSDALLHSRKREADAAQQTFEKLSARKGSLREAQVQARKSLAEAEAEINIQKTALDRLAPQIADARAGLSLRGLEERHRLGVERHRGAKQAFDVQASLWATERASIAKRAGALIPILPALAKLIGSWASTPRPIDGLEEAVKAFESLAVESPEIKRLQEEAALTLAQARLDEGQAREAANLLAQAPLGQAHAPQATRDAIALIGAKIPAARARCLCDIVAPAAGSRPEWVEAFERVMGSARFAIIVDEGYEYEAQRLIQRSIGAHGAAVEVARNDKCKKTIPREVPFKALDLLDFGGDAPAQAFAETRFGLWQMCLDGDLSSLSQGFCLDGRASSHHTLRASGSSKHFQPCFGSTAAAAARASAQAELASASSRLASAQADRQRLGDAASALDALAEIDAADRAEAWSGAWEALNHAKQELAGEEQALAQARADQSNDGAAGRLAGIEADQQGAKSALACAEDKKSQAAKEEARADALLGALEKDLDDAERARDLSQAEAATRSVQANAWAQVTGMPSSSAPSNESAATLARRLELTQQAAEAAGAAWIEETSRHNNHGWGFEFDPLPAAPSLAAAPERFAQARHELSQALDRAAAKCDAKTQAHLEHLRRGVENLVSTNLCDKALNTMDEMSDQLRRHNAIFETADFDNRHFRLAYTPHGAFQQRLAGFREIREARRPDGSLDAALLSPAAKIQFDTLVSMAKLPHDQAMEELSAQCDPVANGEFDILAMEVDAGGSARQLYSLAKQKTASGGENQWAFTLLQVLVAAAEGGSFGSAKADNAIRVIELDEAFDKLNYDRVNALMRHFEDRLGLQVLAAAPIDKYGTLSPLFGKLISVVKPSIGRPGPRPSVAKISSNARLEMARIAAESKAEAKELAAAEHALSLSDAELDATLASPHFPPLGSAERDAPAARAALNEAARRAKARGASAKTVEESL